MSFPHRKRPSLITSAHIVLLVIGTAIFTLFAFNKNIWFDEAYTIGLVRHGVADIFKLHIYDVHPFLYYFLLKIFTFVFGSSLLSLTFTAFRFFPRTATFIFTIRANGTLRTHIVRSATIQL